MNRIPKVKQNQKPEKTSPKVQLLMHFYIYKLKILHNVPMIHDRNLNLKTMILKSSCGKCLEKSLH